jgi:hypothetical protein
MSRVKKELSITVTVRELTPEATGLIPQRLRKDSFPGAEAQRPSEKKVRAQT